MQEQLWAVDLQGRTALHIASSKCDTPGHIEVCKVLMKAMQGACGPQAPQDLSGFTPSAWNAREGSSKARVSEKEAASRSELKHVLYRPGDKSIASCSSVNERCGGSPLLPFGIGEVAGWRVLMEDARCAHSPLLGDDACALFGVFDGHGGPFAARYAATHFERFFAQTDAWAQHDFSVASLSKALTSAMLQFDEELSRTPLMEWKGLANTAEVSGSTAVVALVTPAHVVVANCGDCRAVLMKMLEGQDAGNWSFEALSKDHKPESAVERERIEAAGHQVENGRVDGVLAVSRGVGDFRFKQQLEKSAEAQAVTALPELQVHSRSSLDQVLLMACDGVWDVISETEATEFMQKHLQGSNMDPEALAAACDDLVAFCLERGSEDNMTALAVGLNPPLAAADRRLDFTAHESEDATKEAEAEEEEAVVVEEGNEEDGSDHESADSNGDALSEEMRQTIEEQRVLEEACTRAYSTEGYAVIFEEGAIGMSFSDFHKVGADGSPLQGPACGQGIVVTKVFPEGQAAAKEIQVHVIGTPV